MGAACLYPRDSGIVGSMKRKIKGQDSGRWYGFSLFWLGILGWVALAPWAWAQPPKGRGGPPPMLVEVAPVVQESVEETASFLGTVEPRTRSVVAGEVEGRVARVFVEEGDRVRAGDPLVELDTRDLELQLKEARAALREAEARHRMARDQRRRTEALFQKGLATEKQYRDDVSQEEALAQEVLRLRARIALLEFRMDRSRIQAPFGGVVVRRLTEVGQWLPRGGGVVELIDLDPVRVRVPVPETHIAGLRPGRPVTLTLDALPGRRFQGTLQVIVAQADPDTRTFPVWITVPNPDFQIQAGMTARVELPLGRIQKAWLVPKDALVLQGTRALVYTVRDGKAVPIPVETGRWVGDRVVVRGPVKAGMLVVVRGNERLRPGQPVQLPNSSPGSQP